jgi:zinc-ribbon domain
MRFACQSCGKAYNLPEERIADKSNVKLKCRVCGAIVEVKKQGELVAQLLDEVEDKRMARVSEAPAPLTSIGPDDDETDGATVSISESSINDEGPLQLEMPVLPPAAATGFAAVSMGRGEAGAGRLEAVNVAPPLPPPPLLSSSLPPPPLRALDALEEGLSNGSGGSAAHGVAVNGGAADGSNGSGDFFPEVGSAPESEEGPELLAPVAASASSAISGNLMSGNLMSGNVMSGNVMSGNLMPGNLISGSVTSGSASSGSAMAPDATLSADLPDLPAARGETSGFKVKMAAAFVTGVLIDRILSGLFN